MGNPVTLYDNIKAACYSGNLSSAQAEKMQKDIAALGLIGKGFMAGSAGGFVVTYLIYPFPYIGGLSTITGLFSVAAGIIGYDINTAANNLQEYANYRFFNLVKNKFNKVVSYVTNQKKDVSEQQFAVDLLNTASRNTLVIGTIYSYAIVMSGKSK